VDDGRESGQDVQDYENMEIDNVPEILWPNAWLILVIAVADSGDGATLQAIIAVGDFNNHAIFVGSELRHGMAILTRQGYIQATDDRFFLTGNAKSFWATKDQPRRYPHKLWKEFEVFLGAAPYSPEQPLANDDRWQYPGITDEMVHQAYQSYIGKSRIMKKKTAKKAQDS